VLAGGVEGSKFCLSLVVLPARCVSSISPRFHYRRLAFCFLPLAAILESCLFLFSLLFLKRVLFSAFSASFHIYNMECCSATKEMNC
jgi:SNF family Na+-dependent transporter